MGVFLGPAVKVLTGRSRHRRGTLTLHKCLRGPGGLRDRITTHNKARKKCWQLVTGPIRRHQRSRERQKQQNPESVSGAGYFSETQPIIAFPTPDLIPFHVD